MPVEEIDFMTYAFSPSITNFEKPTSIANSNVFLQDKVSASSLSPTGGPFANIDATISPFSLQIIAPTPKLFNFEKIVASKFNLNIDSEGGCHICTPVFLIGIISYSWA